MHSDCRFLIHKIKAKRNDGGIKLIPRQISPAGRFLHYLLIGLLPMSRFGNGL
jgi:hypothetical protein